MSGDGACIFCSILEGTRSSALVYEGEHHVAFMDKFPLNPGHTLVVPRAHYETLFDMPAEEVGALYARVATLADAVRAAMAADGMNIGQNNGRAASQIVGHVHVHIIPRHHNDSARGWPSRKQATREELEDVAARIRAEVSKRALPIESFSD